MTTLRTGLRLTWFLAVAPACAVAQIAPYSSVDLTASALHSPPTGAFSRFYTGGSGYAVDAAMPLPVGVATLAAAHIPFHGMLEAYRDMTVTEVLFGWGLAVPLHGRLTARAGFRAGEFAMVFDDTVIAPGLRDEKELMLGLTGEAALRVIGPLSVAAQASWDHVHLHVPTHLISLQAGLRYTLGLPGWVQEIVR